MANTYFIIKGAYQRAELMTDMYDKYLRDGEISIKLNYSDISVNGAILSIDPMENDVEKLLYEFVPRLEENLKCYNGKVFIHTNRTEKENKELIKEIKKGKCKEYINAAGETETEHTFYIFCKE